jgi:hypothetical protein
MFVGYAILRGAFLAFLSICLGASAWVTNRHSLHH